ncbi:uncharacterized protein BXZ73DRAFT_17944, partial [Epithele typhae]|uniref:uncharacterized protein n=1 Tax=Epithele typhae TaxID=378194 RepID=UPI0020088EB6
QVENQLVNYRLTTYTTKSLYGNRASRALIPRSSYYCLDVVWTRKQQCGLIDSLLRNFYIPPLVFAVTTNPDGTQTRACIDGKQRLTSIKLGTGKSYFRYEAKLDKGAKRLPKYLTQVFFNKQVPCIEYEGLTNDQEREIFQRVQLGMALTLAGTPPTSRARPAPLIMHLERMQALAGPRPSLIREVHSLILGEDGFGKDLDWGMDRGSDFRCLASVIYLIEHYPRPTFPTTVQLINWLQQDDNVTHQLRKGILETFTVFVRLVKSKKYNMAFSKPSRVSPIEFTMIGVLIHLCKDTHSLVQISQTIWKMRVHVRQKFTAVRQNSKVSRAMFDFI